MTTKDEAVKMILSNNKNLQDEINKFEDLSEIEIIAQEINDITFEDIDFSGSVFAESALTNVHFSNCDLTGIDFTRTTLTECEFSHCTLSNADFSYSTINFCSFSESDMAGAIFNEADLTDSDLSLSENLNACRFDDGTIWPDSDKLPEDFDATYNDDLSSLKDEEDNEESIYDY